MTLVFLGSVLLLLWMANYVFGRFFAQRTRRKGLYIFLTVLGVAFSILMFKILKGLFVIAIPAVILLAFTLLARKR